MNIFKTGIAIEILLALKTFCSFFIWKEDLDYTISLLHKVIFLLWLPRNLPPPPPPPPSTFTSNAGVYLRRIRGRLLVANGIDSVGIISGGLRIRSEAIEVTNEYFRDNSRALAFSSCEPGCSSCGRLCLRALLRHSLMVRNAHIRSAKPSSIPGLTSYDNKQKLKTSHRIKFNSEYIDS